jgi:2-dehydro-3-deoxy-D-arabinonate dehydratase
MNYYKIYRIDSGIQIENAKGQLSKALHVTWDECINQEQLFQFCQNQSFAEHSREAIQTPIESQEIWAAGVTYLRSKVARMEESKESGGDTFYDKVYDAEGLKFSTKAIKYAPSAIMAKCVFVKILPGMFQNPN